MDFQPICFLLLLFLVQVNRISASRSKISGAIPSVVVQVKQTNGEIYEIYASASSASPVAESRESAKSLVLFHSPESEYGCKPLSSSVPQSPFALVVKRGSCTFLEKGKLAQSLGASSLIVLNTEDSLYNETTGVMYNPCTLDCALGRSSENRDICESNSRCKSHYCLSNPRNKKENAAGEFGGSSSEFCCVMDDLLFMYMTNKERFDPRTLGLSAVFVNIVDSRELLKSAELSETAVLFERPLSNTIQFLFLWIFATLVTAARTERRKVRVTFAADTTASAFDSELQARENGEKEEDDGEELDLDMWSILGFFCISSLSLLGLFFIVSRYPHYTVIAFICLFGLGSIHASSYFMIRPFVRALMPSAHRNAAVRIPRPFSACLDVHLVQLEVLIGVGISVLLVTIWFVFRHDSEWVWIIQDFLSVSVTCAFLVNIRLVNLRVAAYLLVSFFFYDVFMTFITPAFFGGKSVMVEVATAGAGTEKVTDSLTCERTEAETMPMLFLIPRFDYLGGFGILGLGDVFLPGLFVVYSLRVDYLKMRIFQQEHPDQKFALGQFIRGHSYYLPVCLSYSFGFLLTILANVYNLTINGVQGQPALLYLVPCTLGTFVALSVYRKDFSTLWNISLSDLEPKAEDEAEIDEENVETHHSLLAH